MQLQISKDVEKKIERISSELGVENEEIVTRAVLFYLDTISKHVELRKEMLAWDKLSDEAILNFDKLLWKKAKSG